METPLYHALKQFEEKKHLRLHIPGHKGKKGILPDDFISLDFTELEPTGNLYQGGAPFDEAQSLWANAFGQEKALFLTGGSTQGVYSALALCVKQGEKVILDRSAHRSAYHICALLRLRPVYLRRPWNEELGVEQGVEPSEVERMLEKHPDAKAVFLTSPNYYGMLSDVHTITKIAHEKNVKVIVDGAHGAHFPWIGIDNYSMADVVTVSAHKTLPALGQAAVLLYRGFSMEEVGECASMFGTSSPSYPIMASMDVARGWMEEMGKTEYLRVVKELEIVRQFLPSITEKWVIDPLRLTVLCHNAKVVAEELERKGIYLELVTTSHLVAVFSGLDTSEEIEYFWNTLLPYLKHSESISLTAPPKNLPEKRMELESVIFQKKISLPLRDSVGWIAATSVAPYPPGVPVVAMGEVFSQENVDYLAAIGYEKEKVSVVDETAFFTSGYSPKRDIN